MFGYGGGLTNALGHVAGYVNTGNQGANGIFIFNGATTTYFAVGEPYFILDFSDGDTVLLDRDGGSLRTQSGPLFPFPLIGVLNGITVEYRGLAFEAMNSNASLFRLRGNAIRSFISGPGQTLLVESNVQFLNSTDPNYIPSRIPEPWTAPTVACVLVALWAKSHRRAASAR